MNLVSPAQIMYLLLLSNILLCRSAFSQNSKREPDQSFTKRLMIPRVSDPWSESLRLVGDEHTFHSDFTLIKDKYDQWHCIGTFGKGIDGVGDGKAESDGFTLFHASGPSLDEPMRTLEKIPYRINTPQAFMWAPGAIWDVDSTTAYMYYFHYYGWEWENGVPVKQILPEEVCVRLLISNSPDLSAWRPYDGMELKEQNMVFREEGDRDFCVFRDERLDKYMMYYCGAAGGPRLRTSDDLLHWSEPVTVLTSPDGDPHGYSESPFVLYRDGYYYLWVSGIDYSHTHLYISEDPFNFGDAIVNSIEEQPGHAPEIVTCNGTDYMACSAVSTVPSSSPGAHDLNGIFIQHITWEKAGKEVKKRITRMPTTIQR